MIPFIADLEEIKTYILQKIDEVEPDTYIKNQIDIYITRFINRDEGNGQVKSDDLKLKVSHQVLCSLGIDLKSGSIKPEILLSYLKQIDFTDYKLPAYRLFSNKCMEVGYYNDVTTKGNDYRVIIFPLKDIRYFINLSPSFYNSRSSAYYFDRIYDSLKLNTVYAEKPFDKKVPKSFFWLTTLEELAKIKNITHFTEAHRAADMLGLSHFNPIIYEQSLFFYVVIPREVLPLTTLKANSTMVNWENDFCGYISYNDFIDGKTFCVTGYKYFSNGLKEQVIEQKIDYDTTIYKTPIRFLDGQLNASTFSLIREDLIKEGIIRFKAL